MNYRSENEVVHIVSELVCRKISYVSLDIEEQPKEQLVYTIISVYLNCFGGLEDTNLVVVSIVGSTTLVERVD